jgi:hypothetical protein
MHPIVALAGTFDANDADVERIAQNLSEAVRPDLLACVTSQTTLVQFVGQCMEGELAR